MLVCDPLAAADPLGRRQRPRRLQPGVGGHAPLGLDGQRREVGRAARRHRPARPRSRRSSRPGSSRSRHERPRTASSSRRVSRGAGGDQTRAGRGVQRRAQGVGAVGEAHQPSGLAHDQLAGGGVDAAAARSVTMPSKRAAATWHSVEAIVPSARSRWAAAVRGSIEAVHPARVSGLDPQQLQPAVARAPLGQRRVQALAVAPRALAAPRPPLLAGAEVVDERERHVGHRLAVGDRDRERVVAGVALGVQRAVDRDR